MVFIAKAILLYKNSAYFWPNANPLFPSSEYPNNKNFADIILSKIKYLTVDEYQDTNPIQERLIHFIKQGGCNLCIVGDDDQTIYQFRGSDPENILTFRERYGINKYIVLGTDYRSSEAIVDIGKRVIVNNEKRLSKVMESGKLVKYEEGDTVYREFNECDEEYEFIAKRIKALHDSGVKYSEVAVLLRKRKHGPDIAKMFDEYEIPYIIEGVNELFSTAECQAAKGIFDYLAGTIGMMELFQLWKNIDYDLDEKEIAEAIATLNVIDVKSKKFYGEFVLQKVYHDFLRRISIVDESNSSEIILYNLGKFSQVINDFETIYYTTIPANKLSSFCNFLKYTADGYYPEGHIANTYIRPDAVNIMTVHQSKGLEFTAVFIPQMNHNNFPSAKMGGKSIWHVIDKDWIPNADRFAGGIEEERKLFYVAITRAKKFLFLTRSPGNTREKKVSEFMVEAKESPYMLGFDEKMVYTNAHIPPMSEDAAPLNLNFSILQDYFDCAYRFKLSMFYGFAQPIVPALGYGTLSDAKLDEELYRIKRKFDVELKKENQDMLDKMTTGADDLGQYEQKFKEQFEKISEANKSALAEYVYHRKIILEMLRKGIHLKEDGRFNKESYIHNLIYPMRKTSEDIEYEAHNLWLIDERLAYCEYISSDIPFDNNPKEERTDILMLDHPIALSDENNTGREFETIVIFELKRPMRDDYDAKENPIQQLLGYVDKLCTNKVTDKNGRLIKVGSNTQFYLYAVCDLTPKMIKVAEDRDFIETPDKLMY